MVQTFMVVRCFKCETFQVDLVKKSNKWKCKVCGERQSIRQVYGKGPAPDCRRHVQKLNLMRGGRDQEESDLPSPPEQYQEEDPVIKEDKDTKQPVLMESSKWAAFIAPEKQSSVEEGESDGEDDGTVSKASLVSGYHFATDNFETDIEPKKMKKESRSSSVSLFTTSGKYDFTSRSNTGSNSPSLRAVNTVENGEESGGCQGNSSKDVGESGSTSKWSHYVDEVCGGGSSSDEDLLPPPPLNPGGLLTS